jgi:hypothetical protein
MKMLKVASKHDLSRLMSQWTEGASRVNNTKKYLDILSDLHLIEKCDKFYRTDTKSEYKDHAKKLTEILITLLQVEGEITIHREITIQEIALRPDAIIFITRGSKAIVIILEVCLTETQEYLDAKIRTFKNWNKKLSYLSDLFNYPIPHYDVVVSGNLKTENEFNQYLKEVL